MEAHIFDVPNHQTQHITNFKKRGDVAMCGVFGYELDVTKLATEEKQQIKEQKPITIRYFLSLIKSI